MYGQHSASLDVVGVETSGLCSSSRSEVPDAVRWVDCGGAGEVRFRERAAVGCGGVCSSARREGAVAELEEELAEELEEELEEAVG